MRLRALVGMMGETVINAGDEFDATSEAAGQRLIDVGYAELVVSKPQKETATNKPAANRETRGGKND